MRPRCPGRTYLRLAYVALAAAALANSGCLVVAASAAAAGGVAGYSYYKAKVPQDFAASFEQTWAATQSALADLGLPIVHAEHGNGVVTFESRTPEQEKVEVRVETRPVANAETPLTRVTVHVAVFGDRPLSEQLLAQVQARLNQPIAVVPQAPQAPVVLSQPQPPTEVPAQTAPPPLAPAVNK